MDKTSKRKRGGNSVPTTTPNFTINSNSTTFKNQPNKKNKNKKNKSNNIKKKSVPKPSTSGLLRKNSFDALSKLDNEEIILVDSLEEEDTKKDEVIDISSDEVKEDLKDNADFIGFDFSDSEDEDNKHLQDQKSPFEYDNYDDGDNNYLSNDDGKSYHQTPRSKLNSEYPWLKARDHTSKIEIVDWLNLEIKDFVSYISPSKEEINIRNEVYKKIKYMVITQLWPDCDVQVFGSFATDLYLPGSDIDMVITSLDGKYDTRAHLYQLSAFLRRSGLGVNVETIAKAKVPIIKFVEPDSRIHIDISFERTNGLTALKNIRNWLNNTPGLRELVLIIKQFLAVRKLNDVHVGGLGGYSIICLVYSFLKLHPRLITSSIDPLENLGILLIEFFELYGLNFGYDNVAILFDRRTKEPLYVPKKLYPDLMMRSSFAILIRDPDDQANNISRGSFNIRDIKRSFGGAFQLLVNKCYDLNSAPYNQRINESILGGVIKYKGKERDFEDARNDVTNEAMASDDDDDDSEIDILPPLPSKVKRRKMNKIKYEEERMKQKVEKSENDVHYYSEYSSDDEDDGIKKIIDQSQDTSKAAASKDERQKLINAIFGIKSDSEDADEEIEVEHSGTDDDELIKVEKDKKRDYWSQKGGL